MQARLIEKVHSSKLAIYQSH